MGNILFNALWVRIPFMLYQMLKRVARRQVLYADVGDHAEFPQQYAYRGKVERVLGIKIETVKSEIHTAHNTFYGYPAAANTLMKSGLSQNNWHSMPVS